MPSQLTPIEKYKLDVQTRNLCPDPEQALAVEHTQRLYDDVTKGPRPKPSMLGRFFGNKMFSHVNINFG